MDTTTDQRKEAQECAGEARIVPSGQWGANNEKPGSDVTRGRGVAVGQPIFAADGMCISPAIDSDAGRDLVAFYNRPGCYTGD